MIDVENAVFTRLSQRLKEEYHGIYVQSEESFERFPDIGAVICAWQMDNYTNKAYDTIGLTELAVNIPWQIDIYSNKAAGARLFCQKISHKADAIMQDMGFARTFNQPTPASSAMVKARRTMRYQKTQKSGGV